MTLAELSAQGAARQLPGTQTPIRVMIVDDSQIARAVLSRMISADSQFEVVATAGNSKEALDTLKSLRVDIILLDVEMPGTSGLDALPDILAAGRGAQVLIVSSTTNDGAEATVRALSLGAADTLPKPGTGAFAGRFSDVLIGKLKGIGRPHRRYEEAELLEIAALPLRQSIKLRAMPNEAVGCLGLGASTGGLHALSEFLRALPPVIGAPILITQHLPAVFMPFFARQIEAASGRLTSVAEDGAELHRERILIAPGDHHLELRRDQDQVVVKLTDKPAPSGCRPSVDPMLTSIGQIYGSTGLGVILSGMGRDGLEGGESLVASGGALLAQEEASCAVWGMPRAVAEAGLASALLRPSELATRVATRIETSK